MPKPSPIACPLAGATALRLEDAQVSAFPVRLKGRKRGMKMTRRRHLLLATVAESPDEPLRHDPAHGGGNQEIGHAHIHETRDGACSVIGVKRRQHTVSGQRRLACDLGRLEIADLTDQDDVGILPDERPKRIGKAKTDLRFDLDLIDAGQAHIRPGPRRS